MSQSEICGKEDIYPNEIILLEGLFTLTDGLHEKGDLNIFTYADRATRLKRRILRDQLRTGQTQEQIIEYFLRTVEPMHLKYIESTSLSAHIIIENNMKMDEILSQGK
jgi:uridine kinase